MSAGGDHGDEGSKPRSDPEGRAVPKESLPRPPLLNRWEIALIRVYQVTLSPVLGQQCRFFPTCSNYGIHALERYGFLRANALIVWRILRCNPFVRGGYDPA